MLSIAEWTDRASALSSPMKLTSSASFSPSIRISLRLKIHQAQAKNFCRVLDIRVPKTVQCFFMHVYSFFDSVPSTFESLTGIGIIRIIGTANQIGIRICEFVFSHRKKIPKRIGYWDCTVAGFSFWKANNCCSCRNFLTSYGVDISICSKSDCAPDGYRLQFDFYVANLNSQYFFAT